MTFPRLRLFTVAVVAAFLAACTLVSPSLDNYRVVTRVIDGDTIQLENHERVRLISVDTPENVDPKRSVEYFGKEAAAFTARLALGQRVRLKFDPANAATAHKDNTQQRRTLAYVPGGWDFSKRRDRTPGVRPRANALSVRVHSRVQAARERS
jgi:endonuclease YncB( thermonuclease family)